MPIPKHVNFDSLTSSEMEQPDTFRDQNNGLTPRSALDIEKQPAQVAEVLKKFLKGNWDLDYQGEDFLMDKILLEFPVFSLNDDYLKSLANIMWAKVESAQNLLN